MRRAIQSISICVAVLLANSVSADPFGSGANEFTIDFVNISGDASSANGTNIGDSKLFNDPGDYRIGTYEITNDQWDKFVNAYGTVTGSPSNAYDVNPYFTGTDIPTNKVSWYEGAQFVNYLNTSTGHQAAYKFTGTQGTSDYTLDIWSTAEAAGGTNLYRHKDAYYFFPTEDEWVKAAYWNGTSLQTDATKAGESLTQGDGTSGMGWNYWNGEHATDPHGPWAVGSGSEELNGTFDMMGNVFEWMESPYYGEDYTSDSYRGLRGGSWASNGDSLSSSHRTYQYPDIEGGAIGFRVASVPEPVTLLLFGLGGLILRKNNKITELK